MSNDHPATGIAKAAEGPNMAFIADCLRNYAGVLENGVIDNAGHYFPADIYDAAEQIEATPSPSSQMRAAFESLLAASEKVLDGLHARIDAADKRAVPVFHGIVDLHDAIHEARAALSTATEGSVE